MKIYKSKIPFLRILIFMILGITLRYYVDLSISDFYRYILLLFSLLLLVLVVKNVSIFKYSWFLSFILLGYVIADQNVSYYDLGPEIEGHHEYVSVVQRIKESDKGQMLYVDVLGIGKKGHYAAQQYRQYVFVLDTTRKILLGDTLVYTGFQKYTPHTYTAPWEFDFAEYLKTQSTYYSVFVSGGDILYHRTDESFNMRRWLMGQNQYIKDNIRKHLPEQQASVAISIFLGDKSGLAEDQIADFREAGLMHIMAVSGLHVGIVYSCILAFLMFIMKSVKLKRWLYIIAVMATWLFILVCGMPASACRAGLMLTFLVVGKLWFPRTSNINLLAVAAFIQVAMEPYVFMTVGFQFSYIAVLGIMFLYQPILSKLSIIPVHSYILQSIAISLAAQLAIGPVSMYYFGFFPTWFWLSSLPAIFLTTLLLWCGVAFVMFSLINEVIASYIAHVLEYLVEGIESISRWTTSLPFSGINYYPTLMQMLVVMALMAIVVYIQTYGLKSLNRYSMSVMFMPLIVANISFQQSAIKSEIYFIPAQDGMTIFIHRDKVGYMFGSALDTATYIAIESKLHTSINIDGAGNEFANIQISDVDISMMSSETESIFIIIDRQYDAELPLSSKVTYMLSNHLERKDIYRWEERLENEHCTYIDLRYETKKITL